MTLDVWSPSKKENVPSACVIASRRELPPHTLTMAAGLGGGNPSDVTTRPRTKIVCGNASPLPGGPEVDLPALRPPVCADAAVHTSIIATISQNLQ
jgi:hypothetical protein